MIQVLSIFSGVQETSESDAASVTQHAIPRRWSSLLIALAVVYCFLLLAGLSWAGWFRVA